VSRAKKDTTADAGDAEGTGGKKKLLIIGLVAVLALGAGLYFFVFTGGSAEAEAAPEAGEVLQIEPVAINLAGGSYLKLGIALQFTAEAGAEGGHGGGGPNGAQAIDIAIAQFSGASLTDVTTNREAMKAALQEAIVDAYHHDVMSIYYTEYVTQ
jgi:flagellar FliL protein